MRIGIYKDTLANGRGADVAVKRLAVGLAERKNEVVVFEKDEISARLLEHWDVVISAGTNELLDLSGYSGAPIVQQFHTNPRGQFKRKRIVRNWRIRRALKRVAAIQVLQDDFVRQVSAYGPPVAVIGNYIDLPVVEDADSARSGKLIVYPAAYTKSKNHRLLIKAFSSLRDDFPDWRIELYGKDLDGVRMPPAVRAFGWCDIREVYAKCDFVAFPSVDEGFGLVIAEAAAFGKPAVMIHDWIGTAKAGGGIVTDPTVAAYAAGLRRLMSDPAFCASAGAKARAYCREHFSKDKIIDKWEALLESVIK